MLQRRTMIAPAAGLFLIALAPALAAETIAPNDTARFLAGLPPAEGSPLAPLTKDGAWQQHARNFDAAFGRLDQSQLAHIRTWSASNITTPQPTVFYTFSGPDFLYANAFFPKAKTYVLAGLEPVGNVPDLTNLRGYLAPNLYHLHASISTLLAHTFFITHRMRQELSVGSLNGTLPILYVFLARSGKIVREVTRIRLDEQGAVQPDEGPVRGNLARGVKIVFAGEDGEARTLYYCSTNLADDSIKNSKFLEFCEALGPGNGLVKSASYLLHSGGFSKVRDFLLANTRAMVQDDSGIPLRYYDPKVWDLQPFGRYLGPISVFPGRYQREYAVLFQKARPIDFGIGYRWRSSESNLLLAIKTASTILGEAKTSADAKSSGDGKTPAEALPGAALRRSLEERGSEITTSETGSTRQ
jgi:hypothetical protein